MTVTVSYVGSPLRITQRHGDGVITGETRLGGEDLRREYRWPTRTAGTSAMRVGQKVVDARIAEAAASAPREQVYTW